MSEITKEMKIAIIEREIAQHSQAVYTLTIQGRCAGMLGNAKNVEATEKLLNDNTKAVAFYKEEIEKLKKE